MGSSILQNNKDKFESFIEFNKISDAVTKFGVSKSTIKRFMKKHNIRQNKDFVRNLTLVNSKKGGDSFKDKLESGEVSLSPNFTNYIEETPEYKTCYVCKENKHKSYFWFKNSEKRLLQSRCKSCIKEQAKDKYHSNKINLIEDLFGNSCGACKNTFPYYIYDFHHINPEEKSFKISDKPNTSYEALVKEAKKCVLLCSNCHRIAHNDNDMFMKMIDDV